MSPDVVTDTDPGAAAGESSASQGQQHGESKRIPHPGGELGAREKKRPLQAGPRMGGGVIGPERKGKGRNIQ